MLFERKTRLFYQNVSYDTMQNRFRNLIRRQERDLLKETDSSGIKMVRISMQSDLPNNRRILLLYLQKGKLSLATIDLTRRQPVNPMTTGHLVKSNQYLFQSFIG